MKHRRRLLTVPGYLLAWVVWLGAAPLWVPLSIAVDVVRRSRAVALRSSALVGVYLTCEVLGILAAAFLWTRKTLFGLDPERWTELHFRLEAWWAATIFEGLVRIFGLRVEIEGDADLGRGPYLFLVRHSSSADTLLASALVSRKHGLRLRYVLKNELLWDPCLDIVGHRLPNVFVDRSSDDSEGQVRRVKELARDLGPSDGVLIYPEGTRFSQAKRLRVLDRFHERGDEKMIDYARSLSFVLPPRVGGTIGLLDAAPEADIVICAHTGFEGAASLAQIWQGALIDQVIRIQFRRIPRNEVPAEAGARIIWLLEEWRRVDAWVGSQALWDFTLE